MGRVADFTKRSLKPILFHILPRRGLPLHDTTNVLQALPIITEAPARFINFSGET